jgi:transketolase
VMKLGSIAAKFAAFEWQTLEVDGHDESALGAGLNRLIQSKSPAPRALIASTVKGKGISFMEDNNSWHYGRIGQTQYEAAIAELSF